MTRVLYVPSTLPWPPDDGERVRCHHLIAELGRRVELTVACPIAAPGVPPPAALQCAEWRFFERDGADAFARLGCALRFVPIFFRAARSTALLRWLGALPSDAFDVVHLDGLPALHYRDAARRIAPRVVHDLRDSWSMLYGRRLAARPSLSLRIKRLCVERLERRALGFDDVLTFVSPVDLDYVADRYGRDRAGLHVVPNGVADEWLRLPAFERFATPALVVFSGAMNYPPNEESVLWFVAHVLPALRATRPGLRFAVVGRAPSERVRALACDDLIVTGAVDSVAEWLVRADVVVAPLRSGAGIKNKVLESLAAGRPTVASPIAVEGIDVEHRRELLVADIPSQWIDAIAGLLDAPDEAARMAAAGRRRIGGRYAWSEAADRYIGLYRRRMPAA